MKIYFDDCQKDISISGKDTEDVFFEIDGCKITLVVPESEIQILLSSYDQASATSPSAADSRAIARIVLDALKKVVEG
jgi:hypothetical protein